MFFITKLQAIQFYIFIKITTEIIKQSLFNKHPNRQIYHMTCANYYHMNIFLSLLVYIFKEEIQ